MSEKEKELLQCLIINPYITSYRHIYNSLQNVRLINFVLCNLLNLLCIFLD